MKLTGSPLSNPTMPRTPVRVSQRTLAPVSHNITQTKILTVKISNFLMMNLSNALRLVTNNEPMLCSGIFPISTQKKNCRQKSMKLTRALMNFFTCPSTQRASLIKVMHLWISFTPCSWLISTIPTMAAVGSKLPEATKLLNLVTVNAKKADNN